MRRFPLDSAPYRPAAPLWVRILGYVLLLVIGQSFLSRLVAPLDLPPPDLFLLTAVALAWRWPPLGALLLAYVAGLLQDLLGAGALGLHAAGLAGAALLVLWVRRYLNALGWWRLPLSVAAALVGQWLSFVLLTYGLRSDWVTFGGLLGTVPVTFVMTLVLAPAWEGMVRAAFGQAREDQGEP